jgi:tetratricopeptide (TPR) repeat protein
VGTRELRLALIPLLLSLPFHEPSRAASADAAEVAAIDLEKLDVDRRARRDRNRVAPRIARYIEAAVKEVDSGNPEEAKRLLLKLRPSRLNPNERGSVFRLLAYVSYGTEDYEGAIGYFEKVLAEEVLSVRDEAKMRFNIAQLFAAIQRWPDVIAWVDQWRRFVETPDPLGFYLAGIAHYQLEDFDAAIVDTKKAVELTSEPREAWLRLLAALYAQQQDYENTVPVLEELVLRYPKKQYWVQLSLLYGTREEYRMSLAVQQVAYSQGLLTEDKELRRLTRSYLYHELPYPAAQVLEKGLEADVIESDVESLELLANSWIAAREYDRSLSPLRQAAERSDDGELYVRLGQVHMQREEWREASEMLKQAVQKGGLEDPGNAQLLIGICYYNDERVARARSSFLRARKHDSTRLAADRWITHLERESASEEG